MTVEVVHVAVGVIINELNQVLIAHRAAHQHQGDKWEFPGGKVEQGETSEQALVREIQEEIGILIESIEPLTEIIHQYQDKKVHLDVYRVENWLGKVSGREGQRIEWVDPIELGNYKFPKANDAIISLI